MSYLRHLLCEGNYLSMGTTTKKTASKTEKTSKNGAVKKNGAAKSNGTITGSYLHEALQEHFGFNVFKGKPGSYH